VKNLRSTMLWSVICAKHLITISLFTHQLCKTVTTQPSTLRGTAKWVVTHLWVTEGGDLSTADWGCLGGRCASLCLQAARGGRAAGGSG